MITIPTHERYLNFKIEVDNIPNNPAFPEEFLVELPHTYGANRSFKTITAEVFKAQDFTGSVTAELISKVYDSGDTGYEKPALFMDSANSGNIISLLDENTNGVYMLLDNTVERILIRVLQLAPGTGRIIFNIRAL